MHRYIESKEYKERERVANDWGKQWTMDTAPAEHPFALLTQTPYSFAAMSGDLWVPRSFKQAIKNVDLWWEPMEKEFTTLISKECWDLVPLPP